MSCIIMDAKTARVIANKNISLAFDRLIEEYTQLINGRILESIKQGKIYYGSYNVNHYCGYHKYEKVMNIVEAKFEEAGYRFIKCTYAEYFRWDDEEL
jgi:hypothetical protein